MYCFYAFFLQIQLHKIDFKMKQNVCENISQSESEIVNVFRGSTIFLTGGSGFMGKILLEKILRACEIDRIYLLMRAKKGKTADERKEEILSTVVSELENKKKRFQNLYHLF